MYFRTLFLLACLAAGPALAEDCLEVIGHSVGEPNQGYGIVEIEWQAEVRSLRGCLPRLSNPRFHG